MGIRYLKSSWPKRLWHASRVVCVNGVGAGGPGPESGVNRQRYISSLGPDFVCLTLLPLANNGNLSGPSFWSLLSYGFAYLPECPLSSSPSSPSDQAWALVWASNLTPFCVFDLCPKIQWLTYRQKFPCATNFSVALPLDFPPLRSVVMAILKGDIQFGWFLVST